MIKANFETLEGLGMSVTGNILVSHKRLLGATTCSVTIFIICTFLEGDSTVFRTIISSEIFKTCTNALTEIAKICKRFRHLQNFF